MIKLCSMHFTSHSQEYCTSITACLKSRLAWSDLEFIQDVILVLGTQGWQKIIDEEDNTDLDESATGATSSCSDVITRLTTRFRIPLEAVGAEIGLVHGEFQEISHPFQVLIIKQCGGNCPDATNWTNVLLTLALLFTLPVSNGKLERVFSTMKNIKVDKWSTLSNETLEDLLFINTDQVSVKNFNSQQ